jgi:hypothetical protein
VVEADARGEMGNDRQVMTLLREVGKPACEIDEVGEATELKRCGLAEGMMGLVGSLVAGRREQCAVGEYE